MGGYCTAPQQCAFTGLRFISSLGRGFSSARVGPEGTIIFIAACAMFYWAGGLKHC
jgi:hypothetical protein